MPAQPSFVLIIFRKALIGLIVGALLAGSARLIGFPLVFQIMFFLYALLGAAVFTLLDAPPVRPLSGMKALVGLILFYAVLSIAYIGGASLLPQYDPAVEKGKIDKLLKAKREKAILSSQLIDRSLKEADALETQLDALAARLVKVAPAEISDPGALALSVKALSGEMTLVDQGAEVYDLYECYNCHKIGGKGSVKKRGPKLDNVGSLLTIEDMKKKIFDPTYLYAEGFEKEHKKGQMPDKYRDLMSEEELSALAAYLSTLKNTAVDTPKPVFVKTKVEHGFIVYGYVRDSTGKPAAGVEVQAKALKKDGHVGKATANQEGYYEIFLHLHNEDTGTRITVSAGGSQKEIVAEYDPDDKVTKRQATVDLMTSS